MRLAIAALFLLSVSATAHADSSGLKTPKDLSKAEYAANLRACLDNSASCDDYLLNADDLATLMFDLRGTPRLTPAQEDRFVESRATLNAADTSQDRKGVRFGLAREDAFIRPFVTAQVFLAEATTDFQRGALRSGRRDDLCDGDFRPDIAFWQGTVKSLSTDVDGRGILVIQIAPNVYMSNNVVAGRHLVERHRDSDLYAQMFGLQIGDNVTFSGVMDTSHFNCVLLDSEANIGETLLHPVVSIRYDSLVATPRVKFDPVKDLAGSSQSGQ